jgi:hypothetical protein
VAFLRSVNNPKKYYICRRRWYGIALYFSRQKGGVIGVDVVDEMLEASKQNFKIAESRKRLVQSEF